MIVCIGTVRDVRRAATFARPARLSPRAVLRRRDVDSCTRRECRETGQGGSTRGANARIETSSASAYRFFTLTIRACQRFVVGDKGHEDDDSLMTRDTFAAEGNVVDREMASRSSTSEQRRRALNRSTGKKEASVSKTEASRKARREV